MDGDLGVVWTWVLTVLREGSNDGARDQWRDQWLRLIKAMPMNWCEWWSTWVAVQVNRVKVSEEKRLSGHQLKWASHDIMKIKGTAYTVCWLPLWQANSCTFQEDWRPSFRDWKHHHYRYIQTIQTSINGFKYFNQLEDLIYEHWFSQGQGVTHSPHLLNDNIAWIKRTQLLKEFAQTTEENILASCFRIHMCIWWAWRHCYGLILAGTFYC